MSFGRHSSLRRKAVAGRAHRWPTGRHALSTLWMVALLFAGRAVQAQEVAFSSLEASAARSEVVSLANGVQALALFGPQEKTSLMLADAGLLSLAFPHEREAVDAFMTRVSSGRPLYFVVSAAEPASWDPTVVFRQDGRSFEARYPESLSILTGEPGEAAPSESAAGVVLLPLSFNLREPMSVSWEGATATLRFRR